jgi:hypothetical protein
MSQEQIFEFLDERFAFDAMIKEHHYTGGMTKAKDLLFREMFSKSIFDK